MDTLLHVGADKNTMAEVAKVVLAILKTTNAEKVKIASLKALTDVCQVENVTISGCNLSYTPAEVAKLDKPAV
jgi:hypothetical protein